jgi:hypothetical protein
MKPTDAALSRREFARRAALGTAAVATGSAAWGTSTSNPSPADASPQTTAASAKLSPQSQAEADARYQAILSLYPDRFSEAQMTDLRRLCQVIQQQLDALRAYSVSNSDQPALYLKPMVERAKASNAPPNLKLAPSPADKLAPAAPSGKPAADSAKPPAAGKP